MRSEVKLQSEIFCLESVVYILTTARERKTNIKGVSLRARKVRRERLKNLGGM